MHNIDNSDEFDVGGNNHFDIYVFRNAGMFGSGKAFHKISSKELEEKERSVRLVVEKAKERVISEFVNFMLGKISKDDLKSNIDTRDIPVKMMSGVRQSTVGFANHQNPLVRISI